jgi:hypothetical protein
VAHVGRLQFFDLEDGEELVLAEFEEGIAFAAVELLQIEDVLIERDRFLDFINLDRDVIAPVNFNPSAARIAYFRSRSKAWIISWLRLRSSLWCTLATSSINFSPLAVS